MEKRHNRRSPWGENDQIGAMNYVTPEMLVRLFQGVQKGKIYDLGQVIQMGAPRIEPFQPPYVMSMWTTAEKTRKLMREHMNAVNDAGVLGVYEFLFILLPVKYKGATASPVRPVGVI